MGYATERWAVQESFISTQENTAETIPLASPRFLVPEPPRPPRQIDNMLALLRNVYPPTADDNLLYLSRFENALERIILFSEKMPCLFAEALSRVADGASITSAGAFELLKTFVVTIDAHAFPVFADWALDDEGVLDTMIPLMVFGISDEDLDGAFDALIALYFAVNPMGLSPMDIHIFEVNDIAAIFPEDEHDSRNVERIKARLKNLPEGHPARGALASLRLIEREDPNVFISCSYLDGNNDLVWNGDNIDMLTEEWEIAEPVVDAHFDFLEWLRNGSYEREEAFVRYIGGSIDELDPTIYEREEIR